ncbi:MAG: hypothetical protein ACLP7F_10660 [Acidimicrobiales bacterium]
MDPCGFDVPEVNHKESTMNTGHFGEGTISLDWTGVEGYPGLLPRLVIVGKLVARGYGVGAVVQVSADVTAWDIVGTYAFLGTTTAVPFVLNWVKQQFVQPNPAPEDETTWDVRLYLPMSPSLIEGLEARRAGKEFSLTIDATVLLIDGGEPKGPRPRAYYATHPTRTAQDRLRVTQQDWVSVLEQWERGLGIPILLPLAVTEPDPARADVVRHVKDARQKIDGADYAGSFASSRKALELLRSLSPVALPIPKDPKDRDYAQRLHAVIDSLFSLASASPHADGRVKDFDPSRADALALAGATASVAQDVFSWLLR